MTNERGFYQTVPGTPLNYPPIMTPPLGSNDGRFPNAENLRMGHAYSYSAPPSAQVQFPGFPPPSKFV